MVGDSDVFLFLPSQMDWLFFSPFVPFSIFRNGRKVLQESQNIPEEETHNNYDQKALRLIAQNWYNIYADREQRFPLWFNEQTHKNNKKNQKETKPIENPQ